MSKPQLIKNYMALTPEGQAMVDYVEKHIGEIKGQLDQPNGNSSDALEPYRAYYAAVLVKPPKMNAVAFLMGDGSRYTNRFWDDYIASLSPVDAARASTPTRESMSEAHTTRLVETITPGLQELADELNEQPRPMSFSEVKTLHDFPRWLESQATYERQQRESAPPLTLQEAIKSPGKFSQFENQQAARYIKNFVEKATDDGKPNWKFILKSPDNLAFWQKLQRLGIR